MTQTSNVSVANELLLTIPHGFEPSSRIKATLEGSYRSNGASCNFRKVRDDVEDILDAMKWAGLISQGQGAPTMDFSDLRPAGSPVSTGGTASGVLSFALMFDSVVSGMRRPGKKNSVGVALLDIEHPEILDRVVDGQLVPGWLSKEADRQFKTAFRAVIINPDRWHLVSKERKDALAEAYNAYRVFICKTREVDDQVLFPNVCFPADQLVSTTEGFLPIKALVGKPFKARLYGKVYDCPKGFQLKSDAETIYELKTANGYTLRCTGNHEVLTQRGWVAAQDLTWDDYLELQVQEPGDAKESDTVDFYYGALAAYAECRRLLLDRDWSVIKGYIQNLQEAGFLCEDLGDFEISLATIAKEGWSTAFAQGYTGVFLRMVAEKHASMLRITLVSPEARVIQQMLLSVGVTSIYENGALWVLPKEVTEDEGIPESTLLEPVQSIKILPEKAPVFCAEVPKVHAMVVQGFTVSNCTEVRLPTKGTCVLGAMNLGELKPGDLPCAFRDAARWLTTYYDEVAVPNFRKRPDLFDVDNPQNRQVGLGVLGMANYLGYNGLTYRQAAGEIRLALRGFDVSPAIASLVEGYGEAAKVFKDWGFVRAFTVQPTASTAYRLKDLRGYNCAPEIQPPQAVRDSEGRPRYTLKSELKGDTDCILPSAIETRDEVPYEVYRDFSEAYQELLNSTGMAHTLSHCFYGATFTLEDLEHFMGSSLESLYYRLDPTDLSKATQKHQTWDTAGDLEFEDDETPTEPLGSCSIDKGYCEACGM